MYVYIQAYEHIAGNFSPLPESPELVQFLAIDDPVDELLLMSYTPTACTIKKKKKKKKKEKKKEDYRKNLLLFIDRSFIAPVRSYVAPLFSARWRFHAATVHTTVKHTVAQTVLAINLEN